jgi:hypothetical protein
VIVRPPTVEMESGNDAADPSALVAMAAAADRTFEYSKNSTPINLETSSESNLYNRFPNKAKYRFFHEIPSFSANTPLIVACRKATGPNLMRSDGSKENPTVTAVKVDVDVAVAVAVAVAVEVAVEVAVVVVVAIGDDIITLYDSCSCQPSQVDSSDGTNLTNYYYYLQRLCCVLRLRVAAAAAAAAASAVVVVVRYRTWITHAKVARYNPRSQLSFIPLSFYWLGMFSSETPACVHCILWLSVVFFYTVV